ncbi:MAG TPA: FtsX-like permease family protein [Bryobacteraceae bacterium]|nr:FtsX-like permease family protein [Bryobacteraceae bacterium]
MPWLRLAWRDLRSSKARFLFVVLAVAVGVGSLTGVRSFSRAFRAMLLTNARTLMAADMTVRIFGRPTPPQEAVLRELEARGVRRTQVTETVTMAATPGSQPLLVTLKAVDPAIYPFYGEVKLEPEGQLRTVLNDGTAVVSEDLLLRLGARTGGAIRLGGQDFRIAAVLAAEPDRLTGTLNVGPRVMITHGGLDRTGLISLGSRASERFLFRLPPRGPGVEEVRRIFKRAFPESTIADYRETHPIITRALDRSTTFLSLVSLIALVVGALGVGTAIDAHLRQKMDTIAILKCLGARSSQVLRIYVVQTLILGVAGGLAGVAVGAAVTRAFPVLLSRILPAAPALGWDPLPAIQGLIIGVAATLLFTVPPLLGVRGIRPNIIFRREMAETAPRRRWGASLVSGAAIVAGIGVIAAWLVEGDARLALRMGAYFAGGLALALLALAGIARLLLAGLKSLVRHVRLPVTLRHGVANLYRPGTHSTAVLVALGVGVMFTLTVFLLQRSLVDQIAGSAPPGMPNVFLLDIPAADRQGLAALAARQAGVERPLEVSTSVSMKIESVNGVAVEQLPLQQFGRRFLRTRPVTWMAQKPAELVVLQGAWWDAARPAPEPQVSVQEEAARILGVKPGSTLAWNAWGRKVQSRVAAVHRSEAVRTTARFEFIFSPGALEGMPAVYFGSMRVRPRDVGALQRALYDRFPTVTVVNVADVLEIIQQVVDQVAVVYRFLSLFIILAGAVILASSVAGTRFRRVREVAILKALGATRRRVAGVFSVEFLLLGAVAGLMGGLLATGFTAALLKGLLDAPFRLDPLPAAAAVVLTALLANAAGWVASWRILGRKPLEVLRD